MANNSNEFGTDSKTLFLKECIADALFRLMKEKPLEKITVDEIVKRAGVGRMTYFRNFTNKLEIVFLKLKSLSKEYYENLEFQPETEMDKMVNFIKWVYTIKDTVSIIHKQQPFIMLLYFASQATADSNGAADDKYKIPFFVYGVSGIISAWVDNNFMDPPDKIIEMLKHWIVVEESTLPNES